MYLGEFTEIEKSSLAGEKYTFPMEKQYDKSIIAKKLSPGKQKSSLGMSL